MKQTVICRIYKGNDGELLLGLLDRNQTRDINIESTCKGEKIWGCHFFERAVATRSPLREEGGF